jgi:chromosomal replication initiator protein
MQNVFPLLDDVEFITEEQRDLFVSDEEADMWKDTDAFAKEKERDESVFNKKYTFDNFVVGKSNEIAAAVAKAAAENPGKKLNPLFIYGGVGLGKTHLLHAVGNYIQQNSDLKTRYVTSERFTNELIESIRDKKNQDFRKRYRGVDVLMIDDIQFIAKTGVSQEELFHTFNDLYAADKQIVLSSDRPPADISPLEERLRSRFASGMIADIQPPDLETSIAILQKKAQQEHYNINHEILQIIAENVTSNIREMEGFLTRVISYAPLTNRSVNDPVVVQEVLRTYSDDKKELVSADTIIEAITNYFQIDKKELVGKKKNKEIVEPRQICIYLISEFLTLPLTAIGQIFGGRDHTTMIHARDKIAESVKTDKRIAAYVKDLKAMILKK